ncbi:Na/Pi cotransporter family protein [Pontiellaceae bacterium B12227]|nr:Na/Pi cotransporter family protein [Pontiellaceae bacterium B12227]
MDWHAIQDILFKVIGGLGIFLLGMKYMSEGMQAVAGSRLRKMISAVTDNRIMACAMGTLITGIVQSSSVTTVMVVGFVNSGFMTLMQAIGVILGANIGTTVTAWIIALKIGKFGLPILGVAAFFFLFSKRERVRYTAMALLGVGMVFFGLQTMGGAFKTPEVNEYLKEAFSVMNAGTLPGVLKCAFFGCLATMIVQSSSATIGVTIVLAQGGIIGFDTAAALVLGLNIGTTVTAFLASLGTSTNAKRAAYAHIIFNVIGTLWLIPFFFAYVQGIDWLFGHLQGFMTKNPEMADDVTAKIALVHTGFNLINTIIFLPLMKPLAKLVVKLVPEKKADEISHLTYFDVRMLDTPSLGIVQSKEQVMFMAESVEKMAGWLGQVLASEEQLDELEHKIFHYETIMDNVQKEIVVFLSSMITGQVTHDVMEEARREMRMADEFESLSDYLVNVLKGHVKLRNNGLTVTKEGREEMLALHQRVAEYIKMVNDAERNEHTDILGKAQTDSDSITHQMKTSRRQHLLRLSENKTSPLNSLVFTDMLNNYRRMKDHAFNIAEVVAGEK